MKSDYIPAPIDVSDIQLPSELCELAEIIAKMYMKYGLQAVWPKDGNMVPKEMMHFVPIPVWCLMRNYPKRKKIMTAGQLWGL